MTSPTDSTPSYGDILKLLTRSTDSLTDDPIQEEIFSVERLEQYAAQLANDFKLSADPKRGRSLLPELKICGEQLHAAYLSLGHAFRGKQSISPAAEWFLDNFHIIEEQLLGIKRDLPESYYYELPKLASGELAGYPRIYAMALAIIAHTDSRLDVETLSRFIRAFQQVSPLRIGELWAVAITLRIALLEHLRPLTLRIVSGRQKREQADALADKILEFTVRQTFQPHELIQMLAPELGSPKNFDRAFIVQLTQRLRDQNPDFQPIFDWLERQLKTHNTTVAQLTQLELHRQAAAQVRVGNIITSMRLLSAIDWRDFFESVSVVDPILAQDPVAAYAKMDFATRDSYRHAVERIAKRSPASESEVAQKAVELANAFQSANPADEKSAHVGYHLIGEGRLEFEKQLRYRPRWRERLARAFRSRSTLGYLGTLTILTVGIEAPLLKYFLDSGGSPWGAFLFGGLLLVPASELALSFLNHYITVLVKPRVLPKMDAERGVPDDEKTIVVIPTLFTKASVVQDLLERLHVHYLANQAPHVYFALLGDFGDAPSETMPGDPALLALAQNGIDELNARYVAPGAEPRFFLFHRKRLWNPSEGKWLGWERKRGKLIEFNRLLRGARETTYLPHAMPANLMPKIKFVITLDSDTQLPRNCANRLIGTALHPLNRPQYSAEHERVIAGYGVLQPRVSVDLISAAQTRFSRIFSGNIGLDPYTTAVSDVYQDLFNEGSFTGKGLYVIDAFEAALAERTPENWILSHDLLEGSYARAALVTDVEIFDDYPADYDTFSKRQHRWTRGDWQIATWLFPWIPDAEGRRRRNKLPLISRWKIFDNLRRSLVAPSMFCWLLLAYTVLPGSPVVWSALFLFILSFPLYAPLMTGAFLNRDHVAWREHLRAGWQGTRTKLEQIGLVIAFLATEAWTQVDAIGRTLYRKLISKKNLLEWTTFAQTQQARGDSSFWVSVGPAPFLALGALVGIALLRPSAIPVAAPLLILWLANPPLKRWLAGKGQRCARPLGRPEIREFREYARRTWHFFETFVDAESHWLAPDNFQEDPKPVIAHRTSPTNIGLQLLSTASAYDFGYIGMLEFIELTEKTLETVGKLEGMHGHLFNWYDTQTLEPLQPRYISTVDSGNLAAHLIALKQACADYARQTLLENPRARAGFGDTLHLLLKEARDIRDAAQTAGAVSHAQLLEALERALAMAESETWEAIAEQLREAEDILNALMAEEGAEKFTETRVWLNAALHQLGEIERDAKQGVLDDVRARLFVLMARCDELALSMDFGFLFDEQRKVFVIGYNVNDHRPDNSYYDLLASESRLASFIAIAKGDVPEEHWFRLGRQMTVIDGNRALIAWTATMFEYLMPLLVMRNYDKTLLAQTYRTVVARQIEYGKQHDVPWGVSESGYNARDLNLNYQYGPFGVPGLGLKRGLSDDLVISPYSTMLAAVLDPWAALANLRKLVQAGALARYGFYEAIDYTTQRLPENQKSALIRSFMAHHQGMSLLSLNNLLHDSVLEKRFHAEPRVQATQLLLQERVPRAVPISRPRAEEVHSEGAFRFSALSNPRFYSDVHVPTPRTQILSNGNYSVMLTSSGAGYSRCGNLAINRWREDWTRDHWGHFFYIRDRQSGAFWSPTYQPTLLEPKNYEVVFCEDKVEILRQDGDISTRVEIIVSPEDDVELRRISITNDSDVERDFEVTSYMETVLTAHANDLAHPAFSNLFVQTEFIAEESALLATRRRRSKNEKQVWGFHVVVTEGTVLAPVQYETDRSRFVGRGRSLADPFVIREARPLSNTVGSVLDPIFSLRETIRVPARTTARVAFATGLAASREQALRLVDKYHDIHIFAREAEIAWTQSQVQLRHLNITPDKAHSYQRLAGRIVFSDPSLRPRGHVLASNVKTQSALWAYGISGDLPILLTRISDEKDMVMVRDLLHAHEYFRLKGLKFDLVILNERAPSYMQFLQDALQRQLRMSGSQDLVDKPGGVFIRRTDIMPPADVLLLKAIARVVLSAEGGTLNEQLTRRMVESDLADSFAPTSRKRPYAQPLVNLPALQFFNGLGGFSSDGQSYQILLREGQWTPAPWINVIANAKDFGFIVSESGSGYTWSQNSRENRLTPWSNDAIMDPCGEAIYLRDEESGEFWTSTPLPIREAEPYLIKHAQGMSQFEHTSHGIAQTLQLFVPVDASVKIARLRLKNVGPHARRLSVTNYVEWVLGVERSATVPTVVTEHDLQTGALLARNPYNNEFATRLAFVAAGEATTSFTCDRREFLGRNGSPARPEAMHRKRLSGRTGAGLDPCAALQIQLELGLGEEREIIFLLGEADDLEGVQSLVSQYRGSAAVAHAATKVQAFWDEALGSVEVKTPDAAMNTLVNRWLPYQTLACRVWARSAFYQSGGAFGFRDQLQDVMALVYSKPQVARAQILCAAARQFVEGDVQHWWHPPTGRGVRTHFSDDLLWLPFVTAFYVQKTGDASVLSEPVSFIEAPPLDVGQDDSYLQPRLSPQTASIFEHCLRAIDRSLKVGSHGLPLMGSGDWNDGMNRVGHEGRGESVWVGWFLCSTLEPFIPFCEKSGDTIRARTYRTHLDTLKKSIEERAWDGDWYRRAYFDDGSALGSAFNEECRIDSIAQTWAVLSGAGDVERARRAMAAVDQYLIDRGDGLVKLFTPPFDQGEMDPGYIKGYVPGVRENGGQYTHAAIWAVMAYAALGDGERAGELFALLNPVNHASNRAGVHKYKVEPYVMAGDIYGLSPHVGRGGWTWYTGSSSWMYRAALESILGFDLRGDILRIKPCIPKLWREFEIVYRRGSTEYRIVVANASEAGESRPTVELDGTRLDSEDIPLANDGRVHIIRVQL